MGAVGVVGSVEIWKSQDEIATWEVIQQIHQAYSVLSALTLGDKSVRLVLQSSPVDRCRNGGTEGQLAQGCTAPRFEPRESGPEVSIPDYKISNLLCETRGLVT